MPAATKAQGRSCRRARAPVPPARTRPALPSNPRRSDFALFAPPMRWRPHALKSPRVQAEAFRFCAGRPVPDAATGPLSNGSAPRAGSRARISLNCFPASRAASSMLLIAPTGAGKTLAGFLPTLVELAQRSRRKPGEVRRGVHTLYISPLKALAVDIQRNLQTPVAEMALGIEIETRTGDTPAHKRQRQKLAPPEILLTTPEQLALLIAMPDAARFFEDLETVVLDELHSLVTSKRGHLLALGIARLRSLRPKLKTIGLSATVSDPDELRRWLVGQGPHGEIHMSGLITVDGGAKPEITILKSRERVPWSGHSARYAMSEVLEAIKAHKTTLLFVNTRSQAEMLFLRALEDQRRQPADRAASWLARCQPAPQGGIGHGREQIAGGRGDLDARPGHRLGRCRPRRPCRRAEGGKPPRTAHRARQSPHGRTFARHPGARQPVRGAGMPGGARCQLSRRAGYAASARRRAGRPGAACAWQRLPRTVLRRCALWRDNNRGALCRAAARPCSTG